MTKLKNFLAETLPKNLLNLTVGITVVALLLNFGYLFFSRHNIFRFFLSWNMFLAGVPLAMALLVRLIAYTKKTMLLAIIPGLVWFFFFPNAPYMLTDFIHIDHLKAMFIGGAYQPNPFIWANLVILIIGITIGTLWGYISLYLMQELVKKSVGTFLSWIFAIIVSVASGIAIYMGRFLRLNSWEIVHRPFGILENLWNSLGEETYLHFLIFSGMTLVTYIIFYLSVHNKNETTK